MIRIAEDKEIEKIKDILCVSFNISKFECEKMLEMIKPFENTFVLETEEGEVVSTASAIPFTSADKTGRYIYAVATHNKHRNKGYASEILEHIVEHYKNSCDVLLLRPARESLFNYYKNLGFISEINIEHKLVECAESEAIIKTADFKLYCAERKKYTDFNFETDVVMYYFYEYNYTAFAGEDYLLLCRKEGECCIFDEAYGSFTNEVIYKIAEIFGAKSAILTLNGNTPFALAHFYNEKFNVNFRVPME